MAERVYLTVAEVVAIQHHQIEEYGGIHGLRDQGLLEAAVFRPQTGYYNDISEEAAALLESLVNNHAFLDGNKRVGFAAMHTFLIINGHDLNVSINALSIYVDEDGGRPIPVPRASRVDCRASRRAGRIVPQWLR